jgi:hypothetical protein
MGEVYLSWADICATYSGEFVLIARPNDERRADVLGGWVIAHSPHEHEVMVAMDLAPIELDLALVPADSDPKEARRTADVIFTLEYTTWRANAGLDQPYEAIPPSTITPARSVKRWWQVWR